MAVASDEDFVQVHNIDFGFRFDVILKVENVLTFDELSIRVSAYISDKSNSQFNFFRPNGESRII